ncbi:MAG: glycosyltransferase family 9 protein [Pseudomonadota bacterium]
MQTATVQDREAFLRVTNDLDAYLDLCAKAHRKNPAHRDTLVQNAAALGYLGRGDEKIALLDQWLDHSPNDLLANVNRGLELLMQGRYQEAAAHYHYRKHMPGAVAQPPNMGSERIWKDQSLDGRNIILLNEQGMGDTIQFVRFAAGLRDQYRANPILNVQEPLRPLFAGSPALPQVLFAGQPVQAHYWIYLGDLLPRFCPTLDNVTFPGAYIAPPALPDPPKFPRTGKLRVGLAWRGNTIHGLDAFRSASLEGLATLRSAGGCEFYALTPNAGAEIAEAGGWVTDLSDISQPFERLAQVIAHMDVVVSVCTSAAHLAAAMGKPVILLLSVIADWRWGRNRDTTPWYPSMRLLRQRKLGDWSELAERAVVRLETL